MLTINGQEKKRKRKGDEVESETQNPCLSLPLFALSLSLSPTSFALNLSPLNAHFQLFSSGDGGFPAVFQYVHSQPVTTDLVSIALVNFIYLRHIHMLISSLSPLIWSLSIDLLADLVFNFVFSNGFGLLVC